MIIHIYRLIRCLIIIDYVQLMLLQIIISQIVIMRIKYSFFLNNIVISKAISNNDNDSGGEITAIIEGKAVKGHLKTFIKG